MLKIIFKSFLGKVVLFTTLLIVGILSVQSAIYIRLETNSLENALIENKKEFAELLAMNLGAAQSLGGFAFQSQLIDESGNNQDTIFVRFVKPDGEIYLSNITKERGEFLDDPAVATSKTIIRNEIYNGKRFKTVIAPGSGGYTTWLGFSLFSIQSAINKTIISRLLVSLLILLLGIFFAYILSNRVTKDITELKKSAEKIGMGNLDIKAEIKSKDEIGDLGAQFNKMADKLKESQERIRKAKTNTEREKAKLETLLAGLGEGIIAIDLKGVITIYNKESEKLFEKKMEECLGKNFMELFEFKNEKGKVVSPNSFPISEVIKTEKPVFTRTYFSRANYPPLPLATVCSPIIFKNKLIGIVGSFRDITEEEKIDKAKTEFVSLASHQLQTPLTAIKWYLEIMISEKKLEKRYTEYVKRAFESNERMIRLVEDFLNVSRLEGGEISVYSEDGDFVAFIKKVIQEAKVIAKKKNQRISFESPYKKLLGSFDPSLITQVISNLLSNSLHYSAPQALIKATLKKTGDKVEIKIADNGIGIPKKDIKMLFSKFFRTKKSARVTTTGSGLGLYIAQKILDVCHGQIKCESENGKGTVFTVILPLKGPTVKGKQKLIHHRIS